MIDFLKTSITRGPDPLRTRPAAFCNAPPPGPVTWHFELPDLERQSLSPCRLRECVGLRCPALTPRNWVRFA